MIPKNQYIIFIYWKVITNDELIAIMLHFIYRRKKKHTISVYLFHGIFFDGKESQIVKIFLGLCPTLSGSTNVAKRLDVIVYPSNIRRVTGHARAECATSIRFQLITVRTWCVGRQPPRYPLPAIFVLQSLLQSSIQFRIPIPYIRLMLDSAFD